MAKDLPYLSSYKNLEPMFQGILSAKRPESFTNEFLANTLGLKSSTDRPLVPFLRTLGFIDSSNRPTREYDLLKNPATRSATIGDAMRRAYAPLFDANERTHELKSEQLKGLIAQVAGTDETNTNRIAWTFNALAKLATFREGNETPPSAERGTELDPPAFAPTTFAHTPSPAPASAQGAMRADFHYNIQIHLPSGATEETYRNIFIALRETFR